MSKLYNTDFELENKSIDEAVATGDGIAFAMGIRRHKLLKIVLDGFDAANDSVTVKVKMANTELEPEDWSTQDADNRWTYVNLISEEDQSDSVTGDTGVTKGDTDADGVYDYAINTNGGNWFNVEVTAYAGDTATKTVTAYLSAFSNKH